MCGRFSMLTYDEVLGTVRSIEFGVPFSPSPEWPARGRDAFPGSTVPLIISSEKNLEVAELSWGYPVSWQKGVVFNTRIESALAGSGMWSESIQRRRCVVPTLGFYEPHRSETYRNIRTGRTSKQQYFFTNPRLPLVLLAGVFEEDHFSVVTTEPNESVSPIHDRMPLVLEQQDARGWLGVDFAELARRTPAALSVKPVDSNAAPVDYGSSPDQLSLF